jgi:hypothetical protein
MISVHGESATRYEGCLSPGYSLQDRHLSQFYFRIDFPENGSFIAIETPRQAVSASADLDLGPAALRLALFVNQHSRRLTGNCANLPLEFQPAVK